MVPRFLSFCQTFIHWVQDAHESQERGIRRVLLRISRFFVLLYQLFFEDRVAHRASSLTYTTLLSLFPALVVVTAMAAVFTGGAQGLEEQIVAYIEKRIMPSAESPMGGLLPLAQRQQMEKQRETLRELTGSIRVMFETFRNNAAQIGFMGFLGVIIAAGLLFYTIENAFNEMWKVYGARRLLRTLTTFTTLIVCTPLLIGLSITVSVEVMKIAKSAGVMAEEEEINAIPASSPSPASKLSSSPSSLDSSSLKAQGPSASPSPSSSSSKSPGALSQDSSSPASASGAVSGRGKGKRADDSTTSSSPASLARRTALKSGDLPATSTLAYRAAVKAARFPFLGRIIGTVIPVLLNGIFLALAYMLIPRTRVSASAAFMGGLAAGLLWEIAKIGFGYYVFSSTLRNALYRSLGAVPIFLVWIYFTWVVFLIGNQLVYIFQNYASLRRERFSRAAFTIMDSKLIFAVGLLIADAFERDRGGLKYPEIKDALGLRDDQLQMSLDILQGKRLIVRTEEQLYILTRPARHILVRELLAAGCNVPLLFKTPDRSHAVRAEALLDELQTCVENWKNGMTIFDVLNDLPPSSQILAAAPAKN